MLNLILKTAGASMQLTVRNYSRSEPDALSMAPRRKAAGMVTILLLLAVAFLDYATGSAPVQHLYYLPIILAGFNFDYAGGVTCAVIAIILYHFANEHLRLMAYAESDYLQIALFLIVGLVTGKLARDRREMRRLAHTDDLTGLNNLRSFESALSRVIAEAQKQGNAVSMLVLDVDRLKALNDVHGHLTGAEAVRTVGHRIAELFAESGIACCYGGDEFAVAMPECDLRGAVAAAGELRDRVEELAPVLAGRPFPKGTLTVSIGVAVCFPKATRDALLIGEQLFREADGALYEAKRQGRNHVAQSSRSNAYFLEHRAGARRRNAIKLSDSSQLDESKIINVPT